MVGQAEYARSPSISLFGQVSRSTTKFTEDPLLAVPRRDSASTRFLAGTNFDIAGRARGTIGIGYSVRDYDAASYRSIGGVSIDSQIQLFPLRRLTITASARRTIEDSLIGRTPTGFWNTGLGLRADYELLRNMIVSASASYSRQQYKFVALNGDTYGAALSGRYFMSRRLSLHGSASYTRRSSSNPSLLNAPTEGRLEAGVGYQL